MDTKNTLFEEFMNAVDPNYREFVHQMNDFLLNEGCKIKIEPSKSGYLVSYSYNKRVMANYVFRKSGLLIRIYGDFAHEYMDFLETLPKGMVATLDKAGDCKRLIDPDTCNPKCSTGYVFRLKDKTYQKCRFGCFMFKINEENIPYIKTFVEKELQNRTLGRQV